MNMGVNIEDACGGNRRPLPQFWVMTSRGCSWERTEQRRDLREFRNEFKKLWERELLNLEENSDHSRRGSTSGADAARVPAAPFLGVLGST